MLRHVSIIFSTLSVGNIHIFKTSRSPEHYQIDAFSSVHIATVSRAQHHWSSVCLRFSKSIVFLSSYPLIGVVTVAVLRFCYLSFYQPLFLCRGDSFSGWNSSCFHDLIIVISGLPFYEVTFWSNAGFSNQSICYATIFSDLFSRSHLFPRPQVVTPTQGNRRYSFCRSLQHSGCVCFIILMVDVVGSDFSKFEVLEVNKPRKLFLEKIRTTGSFPKTTTLPRFVYVCIVELVNCLCLSP